MQLTPEEQKMYDGEYGEGTRKAMEILVALGKIYGAEKMVSITSAQVAGVSYKTMGDAGLEYVEEMARLGAKARVPSFLNPAGMDRLLWREMGVPENFAKKQLAILEAYEKMGIKATCTCAPYQIGIRPKLKEHIAWSESSALSFANSVLGARTNREGGPSALAAALCGVTPYYDLHIDANRKAKLLVKVDYPLQGRADYGLLGVHVGTLAKERYPAFEGIKSASEDHLKALGAAMAAAGSVPLYYVKGITPEYKLADKPETITIEKKDVEETRAKISIDAHPDLIALGCPHASLVEIKLAAELVRGKKLQSKFWVCTAREIKEKADKLGYSKVIADAGGQVLADTCMVVCPIEEMGYKITAVNSGKAAKYLPGFNKQKVVFGDLEEILRK